MKLLSVVPQKHVIDFYLRIEAAKKNKPIPPDYPSLTLSDPNITDAWLKQHHYKDGVLAGFRQWALVELSLDDIGRIAIVDGIFTSHKVLKTLAGTQELAEWVPNTTPPPVWYGPLCAAEWNDEYTVILRPATPGERRRGAALYVEDGSGRSICCYRSLLKTGITSEMRGYIGFDPNPQSLFLRTLLEREFWLNAERYSTLENLSGILDLQLALQT